MNKILQIREVFELQEEINAVLENKVSIATRYNFFKLSEQVNEIVKQTIQKKDELLLSFAPDGQLNVYDDEEQKVVNEQFKLFIADYEKTLDETIELTYAPIILDSIKEVETAKEIKVLFKLVEAA